MIVPGSVALQWADSRQISTSLGIGKSSEIPATLTSKKDKERLSKAT